MSSIITQNQIGLPKPNYSYITNEEDARKAMSFLDNYPIHAIDTETTALDPYEARWTLLQIGVPDKSFVFDVRHDTKYSSLHPEILNPLLQDPTKMRILQNASYDMKIIKRNLGFYLTNVYDTMLAEQLSTLGLSFTKASLAALVFRYLGLNMPKEPRDTFGDYEQKYEDFQLEYAANDVVPLHLIRDLQWPKVQKEGLENAARLEFEFIKPLCEMELNGINIDTDKWRIIMKDVEKERIEVGGIIRDILSEIEDQNTLFGVSLVNIDSNAQLKRALNRYGLPIEKTDVSALEKHAGLPIIDAILDYRKANKLVSTYAETLLSKISKYTGRLHTDFRQMVSTGRMSSSNPNLQNIPKKQKYRSCFVAAPGYKLLTADMSSAELRILGNLSQDPIFIEAYSTGQDLHTRTASEIFDVAYDRVEKHMRNAAKSINFGLCLNENSNLLTNFGIVKIKDVIVGSNIAHDVGSNLVIDKKYMGEKEVFEITTKYGYTMECTEDHLLKVIDENGKYIDKKLKDVDIKKDYICIKKNSNLYSKDNFLFPDFDIERRTNFKDFDLPNEITIDWAKFLGLFVSEGHLHKDKSGGYNSVQFGISSKERDFVEVVDSLLTKLFVSFSRADDLDTVSYSINSVKVAKWLFTLFEFDLKSKTNTISIPECIKKSTKDIQVSFIQALFEGDGTIWKHCKSCRIKYDSKSFDLLYTLQLMLLNIGILSSLKNKPDKRYPNDNYYSLEIIGQKSKDIFMKDIGFLTRHKNSKWLKEQPFYKSSFFVPYQRERALKIRDEISNAPLEYKNRKKLINSLYNNATLMKNNAIGDVHLDSIHNYDDFLNFIYENNIVPLPIESIISKGVKRVYDLSIENHQYFLANGFIVHNCYGMSPVGLSKRLKITKKEAEVMINKYFNRYRGIKRYLDKAGQEAVRNRYSVTASGRRRYYNMPAFDHPDRKIIQGSIERQGMNAGIQGSNADTIKESMILLVERLKGYDARLILTVHDEVVVEAKEEQSKEVAKVVAQSLVDGFGKYFNLIPMETDTLIGPCWMKDSCGNEIGGHKCGSTEMKFVEDSKYGSKLVCAHCGAAQE